MFSECGVVCLRMRNVFPFVRRIVYVIKICRNVISCFLNEYETLLLVLGDEYRLRLSDNRMLMRVFKAKMEKTTGGWRNCGMRDFLMRSLQRISVW
jgi:hypothetical protein